jgi:hypothetical protein
VRPEAVEALTQAEFVRITPAQQELVARAIPPERQVAALATAHAREARRLLEELGVLKVPTLLDVTPREVHHLQRRANALTRAPVRARGDVAGRRSPRPGPQDNPADPCPEGRAAAA